MRLSIPLPATRRRRNSSTLGVQLLHAQRAQRQFDIMMTQCWHNLTLFNYCLALSGTISHFTFGATARSAACPVGGFFCAGPLSPMPYIPYMPYAILSPERGELRAWDLSGRYWTTNHWCYGLWAQYSYCLIPIYFPALVMSTKTWALFSEPVFLHVSYLLVKKYPTRHPRKSGTKYDVGSLLLNILWKE